MRPSPHPSTPGEPESALDGLRTYCIAIGAAAGLGFASVFGTTVIAPDALRPIVAVGMEIAFTAVAALCALIVVVVWILTRHTRYALWVWAQVNNARTASSNRTAEILKLARDEFSQPDVPIPITDAQQRRHNRHAV